LCSVIDIVQIITAVKAGIKNFCLKLSRSLHGILSACVVSGGDIQCIPDDGEGEAEEVADTSAPGLPLGVQTPCHQSGTECVCCRKEVVWLDGVVVRALDLQPVVRRFESRLLRFTNDLGQVVHTHVPLFIKQYKLVMAIGR